MVVCARPFILTLHAMLALIFLSALSAHVSASTELNVSVDKNKLYQNEILNLTVQANTEVDFSLGGLMNFGGSQIASPSFAGLEEHWDVIDKQQSYNMQSINGATQSTITWRYALSPKKTGNVLIPAATFKDATSEAGYVEVVEGGRPRDEANPPAVFLKAEVDKTSPYLQEQVVYRLQLYTLGEARGDMSAPAHPDFIIEEMGETAKRYEMEYNRRYEVYERRYLLFPQKSGALTIDAQAFTGSVIDNRTRRRARAREVSNTVTLDVKAPPASFSGDVWLPATSLFLEERWDADENTILQGDSVTRQVTLNALGLLGSALPEVKAPNLSGLKIYPDQPTLSSVEHQSGVQSNKVDTQAIVAVAPGTYTLPEIKITWWDTANDAERVSSIPSRTISVEPAPANSLGTDFSNGPTQTNSADSSQQSTTNSSIANSSTSVDSINNSKLDTTTTEITESGALSTQQWLAVIALILVLWMVNVLWLSARSGKRDLKGDLADGDLQSDPTSWAELVTAVQTNSPALGKLLCVWLSEHDQQNYQSMADAKQHHPQIFNHFHQLEASRYSSQNERDQTAASALVDLLKQLKHKQKKTRKRDVGLKPFYPA